MEMENKQTVEFDTLNQTTIPRLSWVNVIIILVVLSCGLVSIAATGGLALSTSSYNATNQSQIASVTINPELTNQTQIVLKSVTLPENGYVVIYGSDYNSLAPTSTAIIGRSKYTQKGTYKDVYVKLFNISNRTFNRSQIRGTERIYVVLHDDTNWNGEFDYVSPASPDGPFRNESGLPVADSVVIGIDDTTGISITTGTGVKGGSMNQHQTSQRTTNRAGTRIESRGDEGFDMTTLTLTLIVGILLGGGYILVTKSGGVKKAEREHSEISLPGQAIGRLRTEIIPYTIDIRAYGLPTKCEKVEINITADDSDDQKAALRELASTQKFQMVSGEKNTEEPSSSDEYVHREGTLQLRCETIKTIQTAAQDGDEQSQRVLTAVKYVLDAYAPEAITAVKVQTSVTTEPVDEESSHD